MKKGKLIAGVILLLLLGMVVGSLITRAYFKRWFVRITVSPQARTEYIMDKMSTNLNLSPDQRRKIGEIVRELEEERQKARRRDRQKMMEQIKMELNAEQQQDLESVIQKFAKPRPGMENRN
jgi:hypothetical protein